MKFDIDHWIEEVLLEDVGSGDHTSLATIPHDAEGKAKLLVKENGILAGIDVALAIFKKVDPRLEVEVLMHDGDTIKPGDIAFYVTGNSISILTAERLVLNIMQRMSGIATKTNQMVSLLKGTNTRVLDTRKTTPGLRYFEKLAVKIGGGVNHRFGLYDMILIKDNHIDYAGSVTRALQNTKDYLQKKSLDLKIEVEARDLAEVEEILHEGGVDRILLDNFDYTAMRKAVKMIGDTTDTEASGGITEATARQYAECGVDYISSGALTHSVKSLDLSLKAV